MFILQMATASCSKHRTRHSSSCKLSDYIGGGKEFILSEVPTNRAVIQRGILLRENKCVEDGISKQNYSKDQIAKDQWLKSNVKFTHQ